MLLLLLDLASYVDGGGGIKGPIRTPLCALRVVFQGSKVLVLEISAPCPAAGGATLHVKLMLVAGETVRVLNDQ